MERVLEVAVLTEILAVARVAGLWEGVKFCRAPVSWGEFRRGEALEASGGAVARRLALYGVR